jgi:predicted AAA+ superfamily ATPase
MIPRDELTSRVETALERALVTTLLGPRQCGKTTLARAIGGERGATHFDLESVPDQRRLENPELVLGSLDGLVVLDEIQRMPELFSALRVLVDRPGNRARFLVLGSASPDIVKNVSQTLAGRTEIVELTGFGLEEIGFDADRLWLRGGFPRSFLANSDQDSRAWREGFVRTFLERDVPELGIRIPAVSMRRFWTMLAHFHGQTLNASAIGRSLGISDKTVRSYLDILTGAFMMRQLVPWHENLRKRQVKSPKIYFRDSGLLHSLLEIPDRHALLGHPRLGASWEGFALEQVVSAMGHPRVYFWSTHGGAELDLFFLRGGERYGVEFKFSEAPTVTKSMRVALDDLSLAHLWIVSPGKETYRAEERITVIRLADAVVALNRPVLDY